MLYSNKYNSFIRQNGLRPAHFSGTSEDRLKRMHNRVSLPSDIDTFWKENNVNYKLFDHELRFSANNGHDYIISHPYGSLEEIEGLINKIREKVVNFDDYLSFDIYPFSDKILLNGDYMVVLRKKSAPILVV